MTTLVMLAYLLTSFASAQLKHGAGFWDITQINLDRVDVTYQFHADAKEKIPDWIARRYIVENPFKTLLNLRTIMQNKYFGVI